ncbi:MAG: sigma-54-dependent transcriptional regulator [Thermodesulfobacteriota bacterium]
MTAAPKHPKGPKQILLVEDDPNLQKLLCEELEEAGFTVRCTANAEEAYTLLPDIEPELVISDLRLPGADGMQLLHWCKETSLSPGFLIITAFGTIPQAVQALKSGADDFLTKPLDLDHLQLCVQRILEKRSLQAEVSRFRDILQRSDFQGMIGQSTPMQTMFQHIEQIAQAQGPVLILGESGVGKELVAKALHDVSPRKHNHFLAINCAGIPAELLESEFFGHEAGAFTGASKKRQGLFQQANQGTLFLDEIGEMPYSLQSKLLRVLQDGTFRPVGANKEQQVDVRIICATNQNLEKAVQEGDFREDLFFRLETFSLEVPPLRRRNEDIHILAGHFVKRFSLQLDKSIHGFTEKALGYLQQYDWPGNVRELQNSIERAVTFCSGEWIDAEHLPTRIKQNKQEHPSVPSGEQDGFWQELLHGQDFLPSMQELERLYLNHVLEKTSGNKRRAAAILGVSRRTLYRKLENQE